jgi:transposase InsO family protein
MTRTTRGAQPCAREIWAADFFTVPTLSLSTLYVFFLISHGRRRIEHINVTRHPNALWVWRQLIEATPWGTIPCFLIPDRDRSYGGDFIVRAQSIGIRTVLTPVPAPKANAIAERVVGTLRRECVDHIIPLSERHLRSGLTEYVEYYNATRPHRTLELEPPEDARPRQRHGRVVAHPVLGGIHHRYERSAA